MKPAYNPVQFSGDWTASRFCIFNAIAKPELSKLTMLWDCDIVRSAESVRIC